jgi:hypothetical protein
MSDVVSAGRDSPGELAGHRAACCIEPIPLNLVGQGWNGDDLSLVETGEARAASTMSSADITISAGKL